MSSDAIGTDTATDKISPADIVLSAEPSLIPEVCETTTMDLLLAVV